MSQYAQRKMPQAEATLRRATEIDPKMPGYHVALAAAMKHQGKLRKARGQLELEPRLGTDPEASQMMGEVDAGINSQKKMDR